MVKFVQLPKEMQDALIVFQREHGRYWRHTLKLDRMSSTPQITGTLRAFMNAYGDCLDSIKVPA